MAVQITKKGSSRIGQHVKLELPYGHGWKVVEPCCKQGSKHVTSFFPQQGHFERATGQTIEQEDDLYWAKIDRQRQEQASKAGGGTEPSIQQPDWLIRPNELLHSEVEEEDGADGTHEGSGTRGTRTCVSGGEAQYLRERLDGNQISESSDSTLYKAETARSVS
jgi:hypothetical protein